MIKTKHIQLASVALGGLLGLTALTAQAGSELEELLKVLRDNGTISQDQYQRLQQETAGKKDKKKNKDKQAEAETEGGLKVKSANGEAEFEIGGEIWVDGASYQPDVTELSNGTELRRARLSVSGKLLKDWGYALEYDLASNEAKDAYLEYTGFDGFGIKLGNFKEAFTLEDTTSGKATTFMERALPVDAFSPGRNVGLGVFGGGKHWSLGATYFGDAIDAEAEENEGQGTSARLTVAPINDKRHVLHLGGSAVFWTPDDSHEVRYRTSPESSIADVQLVSTGRIQDFEHSKIYGLEAAYALGPFSLQGEYIKAEVERETGLSELEFDGWYVYGSWVLTGESRPYSGSRGRFNRIMPKGNFGAWELALRYSTLDLTDKDIEGGEEKNLTLGLNTYLNDNVRLRLNYIRMKAEPNQDQENEEANVFQLRGELYF